MYGGHIRAVPAGSSASPVWNVARRSTAARPARRPPQHAVVLLLVLVLVRRDYVCPFRTRSARPTRVNASTARSMWAVVCAAETCTRMRERPRGTTGKKKPFT